MQHSRPHSNGSHDVPASEIPARGRVKTPSVLQHESAFLTQTSGQIQHEALNPVQTGLLSLIITAHRRQQDLTDVWFEVQKPKTRSHYSGLGWTKGNCEDAGFYALFLKQEAESQCSKLFEVGNLICGQEAVDETIKQEWSQITRRSPPDAVHTRDAEVERIYQEFRPKGFSAPVLEVGSPNVTDIRREL